MNILRACFSFYGRAGRAEYAVVFVGAFVLLFAGVFVAAASSVSLQFPAAVAAALIIAVVVLVEWAILAAVAKRLHDIGRRTSDIVYTFIPLVGLVVMLGLMVVRGNDGANEYGTPRSFFSG